MKKLLTALIALAAIVVGYFYLFQPHITLQEVRASDAPQIINVVYVNVTGEPLCAKLYRIERVDNDKPIASNEPVFPALPGNLPTPDDGALAYSDNMFKLTGYKYQLEKVNHLTGKTVAKPSHRFDLIAWEVIPPYKKWDEGSTTDGNIKTVSATKPVAHQFNNSDHSPGQFVKENYIDCLR